MGKDESYDTLLAGESLQQEGSYFKGKSIGTKWYLTYAIIHHKLSGPCSLKGNIIHSGDISNGKLFKREREHATVKAKQVERYKGI